MLRFAFIAFLFFLSSAQADEWDNGYTEPQFNKVLDVFDKVYSPIITARGGVFEIDSDWTDGSVSAFAWREGNVYRIEVPGGLARYGIFHEDAYILFVCHELGHLLGGEPMSHEISFEGQADYYSTNSCMKLILPLIKDQSTAADPEIRNLCKGERICERSLLAALPAAKFDAKIANVVTPKFSTPDQTVVSQTMQKHPKPQCRLDTRKAGALNLARPACWFSNTLASVD